MLSALPLHALVTPADAGMSMETCWPPVCGPGAMGEWPLAAEETTSLIYIRDLLSSDWRAGDVWAAPTYEATVRAAVIPNPEIVPASAMVRKMRRRAAGCGDHTAAYDTRRLIGTA